MSLQEPQEQFERTTEESMDDMQDSSVESPLSDSDTPESTPATESAPVPTREKLPQSSDTSLHTEGVDGPAWYVIHCYSGYENKVRHNLEQRIETMGMRDRIFDVVIPTQEEIEVKDGKRRTVERHIFPGYVLVNLLLSEESWYVVSSAWEIRLRRYALKKYRRSSSAWKRMRRR
jgi:transcriptional antiterminator NusG